jgi:hypothetical protein
MKVVFVVMRRYCFLWVRLVFPLYVIDAFGYPVASSWMSRCGIPTRKLRIILMRFLVMCVFSWVYLAVLIMY